MPIRIASADDLPALRELFARANDAPYDLAAVAEEKCFGSGIAGAPVTRVFEENDRLLGAAVHCGKWLRVLAVDRDSRRRGIGTALLGTPDVIAAEPGNYFTPGVVTTDEGSLSFFRARGYVETRDTHNLLSPLPASRGESLGEGVRRPSHEDASRVLAFVEAEFGRIWRFEAAKAFERDIPPAFITEEHGAITGFAVHDVNNRGLGFFGPTGVAQPQRGRGLGCRLLLASLADLHRLGYAHAVIPWTDALAFYRKCCGAEPAHRFVALAKPQP
ncbi:MAG TPA: GNAT family N-acetyltransferase [Thermoanaerobaculia bacterium]|nr:GNAT family N-acetyltransferase [Thermoanaerobaculia bacterium]